MLKRRALDNAFRLLVPKGEIYLGSEKMRGLLLEISQSRSISYVEDDVDVILRVTALIILKTFNSISRAIKAIRSTRLNLVSTYIYIYE